MDTRERLPRGRTVGAILAAWLVALLLVGLGVCLRLSDASAIHHEVLARETAQWYLWVFLGLAATLLPAPFLLVGSSACQLRISTGVFLAAIQVGTRLCFAWHLVLVGPLRSAKQAAVRHGGVGAAPQTADLIAPYFWIAGLCGTLAFCALVAALRVLPDLWTNTRSRVGVCLWGVGVSLAILYVVPVMRFIVTWHSWLAVWEPQV
ncbi:MAG: hypothetical protein HN904_14250 [Victivallales bacterium]|jgi:hypothetical protein|nr:hypothetical protein [Victivallales bacterium]MBT7163939.1 hypothetical protein [Victivallales bacterium]